MRRKSSTSASDVAAERRESRKVGRKVDNVACEVEGVVCALEMLVEQSRHDLGSGLCYILTDCQSAVDIVVNQKDSHRKIEVFRKVWSSLKVLKELGTEVRIAWIPGHANIHFNEVADLLAKQGSMLSSTDSLVETEVLPKSVCIKLIRDKVQKLWTRMWERSESADWTKELLGIEVGRKLVFPSFRSCGMSYVRSLVNNAAVKDNLSRMGFSEEAECECGESRETVTHVLMECKLEDLARQELIESVQDLWMESRCQGNLNFNIKTVLCPFQVTNVTADLGSKMLKESFKFLNKLTRKL